jgi:hypothetical protein
MGFCLSSRFVDRCGTLVWNDDCTIKHGSHSEQTVKAENEPIEAIQRERRTDVRIIVNVPVEIRTIYHKGGEITERTIIDDVSDFGCRFTMRGAIQRGDTVAIHLLAQDGNSVVDEPAKIFEVMWIARDASVVVVGAKILGGEKFDKARLLEQSGNPKHSAN